MSGERLNQEHQYKIKAIAAARGLSLTTVVGELIDAAYEQIALEQRFRAAQAIAALALEDMPEPAVLAEQLAGAYDIPDFH